MINQNELLVHFIPHGILALIYIFALSFSSHFPHHHTFTLSLHIHISTLLTLASHWHFPRLLQISIWLSGVAITVILSVVAYAGLVIYSRYLGCDPISSGLVSTKVKIPTLIGPIILLNQLPTGPFLAPK